MSKEGSTFIGEIATEIFTSHGESLDKVTIVFPNRRAGVFLRKELGKLIEKPIWMPSIYSMEDFVLDHHHLEKIDKLEAVFELFEVYRKYQKKEESFEKFYFWGEMILRDFEEIDQYLVSTENLFKSIKTQKELDEEFFFLDEEEKKIIRSFWTTFLPEASKTQESFLETWKLLLPIYQDFTKTLVDKGKAYNGLIYRDFTENLSNAPAISGDLYFAGFNALTLAEEKIIKHYIQEQEAKVFWDFDPYYMGNTRQEAGEFMRLYAQDRQLGQFFDRDEASRFNKSKNIHLTGVSLEVGQTKAAGELLSNLYKDSQLKPEETVVVLPFEYMLFPVLESIPQNISDINITMGYPLKDTPVFGLIDSVLYLQETRREHIINGLSFYHKPFIEILNHPLLAAFHKDDTRKWTHRMVKENRIHLLEKDLPELPAVFENIFRKAEKPFEYIAELLHELHTSLDSEGHELELEFIARYYEYVLRLNRLMGQRGDSLSFSFLQKLFRRLAGSLKIPFAGEPLKGLQIMGILETRNLDFRNVIVLSMNEDAWPAPPAKGSFIPYNIRKAFQLPTHEHHDSIYSYLFYRLLQRAENIHFYYNTVSEFNMNGEVSRFVRQLEFESPHQINKDFLANPVNIANPKPIIIHKDQQVFHKLSRYTTEVEDNYSNFTPTALDHYLQCKLKFYFRYVERLYEPEEVQDNMDAMVFGNLLHNTMEMLYRNHRKETGTSVVDVNDFFGLEASVDATLNRVFAEYFGAKKSKAKDQKFIYEGKSVIASEIIAAMVRQILKTDQKYAPFEVRALEEKGKSGYSMLYPVQSNGSTVRIRLEGIIDRVDKKNGVVRIIDYKTGRDEKVYDGLDSLLGEKKSKRNKAVFQVMYYSYLYANDSGDSFDRIEPGIFNSRELFKDSFDWRISDKSTGHVTNFMNIIDDFEDRLSELLHEIWNPEVPFDQTEDRETCKYCPYKRICHR